MAYVDWSNVADAVRGDKRLKEILLPHVETSDAHPFLAKLITRASQFANSRLAAAGYTTPLPEPVTDEVFRASIVGLIVGYATESGTREPYEEALYRAALAYFESSDLVIVGAEEEDDGGTWPASFGGAPVDAPIFDTADPYAAMNAIAPPLPVPRRRRW